MARFACLAPAPDPKWPHTMLFNMKNWRGWMCNVWPKAKLAVLCREQIRFFYLDTLWFGLFVLYVSGLFAGFLKFSKPPFFQRYIYSFHVNGWSCATTVPPRPSQSRTFFVVCKNTMKQENSHLDKWKLKQSLFLWWQMNRLDPYFVRGKGEK